MKSRSKNIKGALIGIMATLTLSGCSVDKYVYDVSQEQTTEDVDELEKQLNYNSNEYTYSTMADIKEVDKISILERYRLPSLERMSQEDQETYLKDIQILNRIEKMDISPESFLTPEYNWKQLYTTSLQEVNLALNFETEVEFEGKTAQELNDFMQTHQGKVIKVLSETLVMDESLNIPSNVYLKGDQTKLIMQSELDKVVIVKDAVNVGISGFIIEGDVQYGVYVTNSKNILLYSNEVSQTHSRAIVAMGECERINIVNNYIHHNEEGAIFLNGNINNSIIQGNTITNNKGTDQMAAGIVLGSLPITDIDTVYNEWQDLYLYDITQSPNNNVIKDNIIEANIAIGIYSQGGYMNYIIDNKIRDNGKEGVELSFGTFGTFVGRNDIIQNGSMDKVAPGISIDNGAYNIIQDNYVSDNYGSGIKIVRSGFRNIMMANNLSDNNYGANSEVHFFGIEIGNAPPLEQGIKGLDFLPSYENIICRNTITGAHYSGVFLAEESYINDIFDNIIMDSEVSSIECLSEKLNNNINNIANK